MLRSLTFKPVYRSETDSLLEDFYVPALREAVSYDRAVGFFSAAMLSYAAQGLAAFFQNEGKMRLIIGGELDSEDDEAIRRGYDARLINERFGINFIKSIERIDDSLFQRRVEALAWLVAHGRLDIKIAFRRRGMYHEKIGIIRDSDGDGLVFQGSANETAYALLPDFNFESINVFPTWDEHLSGHYLPYIEGFERLWSDNAKDTRVLDFPTAAREHLIKISQRSLPPKSKVEEELFQRKDTAPFDLSSEPYTPSSLGGKPFIIATHQIAALQNWKANQFQGILALATGAGKTITSIYGAVRYFTASRKIALIIAVPYQNLADQWVDTLHIFGFTAHSCFGAQDSWRPTFSRAVDHYQAGALAVLCAVVVNKTLQAPNFQILLNSIDGAHMLFVGDECHHHSSVAMQAALPPHAQRRIGLSATPEHYVDESATARLIGYYGKVVAEYTLADALRDKVITPYEYHVHVVTLSDEEAAAYTEISERISRIAGRQSADAIESTADIQLKTLLAQRARLVGTAREKLFILDRLLELEKPSPFTLFYCGDGSVEDEDTGEVDRHVEQVTKLLAEHSWICSSFTARESRGTRRRILDDFRLGNIDALVAIKCLDEGIDIPACRTAFLLASSRNPKQFIQRRGRILRRSEGKEYAIIHDFLVRPPPGNSEQTTADRNLVKSELLRVTNFSKLSIDPGKATKALLPTLIEYDLAHMLV